MDIDIKKQLLNSCLQQVEGRLKDISVAIQQAQEAIENETKSSAGDKYETSREMVQQDLNRYHTQLSQAKRDGVLLQNIDISIKERAELGAVVVTDQVVYFIAISLGQQQVEGLNVMVISPASPIGKLLLGLKTGNQLSFNGKTQYVKTIY